MSSKNIVRMRSAATVLPLITQVCLDWFVLYMVSDMGVGRCREELKKEYFPGM
jgi:hypothetical protein